MEDQSGVLCIGTQSHSPAEQAWRISFTGLLCTVLARGETALQSHHVVRRTHCICDDANLMELNRAYKPLASLQTYFANTYK